VRDRHHLLDLIAGNPELRQRIVEMSHEDIVVLVVEAQLAGTRVRSAQVAAVVSVGPAESHGQKVPLARLESLQVQPVEVTAHAGIRKHLLIETIEGQCDRLVSAQFCMQRHVCLLRVAVAQARNVTRCGSPHSP
jgi:hypothetical protein